MTIKNLLEMQGILRFFLKILRASEHRGRGAEREGQANSTLTAEPDSELSPTTLRS